MLLMWIKNDIHSILFVSTYKRFFLYQHSYSNCSSSLNIVQGLMNQIRKIILTSFCLREIQEKRYNCLKTCPGSWQLKHIQTTAWLCHWPIWHRENSQQATYATTPHTCTWTQGQHGKHGRWKVEMMLVEPKWHTRGRLSPLQVALSVQGCGEGHVVESAWNSVAPSVGSHALDAVFRLVRGKLLPQDLCCDEGLKQKSQKNITVMSNPVSHIIKGNICSWK